MKLGIIGSGMIVQGFLPKLVDMDGFRKIREWLPGAAW